MLNEFFMVKSITIKLEDEDVFLDVDDSLIRFYEKEANRKKVTEKGLIKFFSNIIKKNESSQ